MITLYAWVGLDETGDYGLKSIVTPLGVSGAAYATLKMARHPIVLQQIQLISDKLNKPMRLVELHEVKELEVLSPRPR